jgi:hypothetical protein
MDVLDKFFKKYSYKFPKGYPDMNNKQDVLLLENILKELGIDLELELEEAKEPLEKLSPKAQEVALDISDKLQIPKENIFKDTLNRIVILTDEPRENFMKQFIDLGFKRDVNIGGSTKGGVKSPEGIEIIFKPLSKQGSKSSGKENERSFESLINSKIEENGGPITVILKSSNGKNIKIPNVSQAKDVSSVDASEFAKADVQLLNISDNTTTILANISLKKRNAIRWESSKTRSIGGINIFKSFIDKVGKIGTDDEVGSFKNVVLKPLEKKGKYKLYNPITKEKLSKVIITNIPENVWKMVIFGNDNPKTIVIKEDFEEGYSDYTFENEILTLNCYLIYTEAKDVEGKYDEPVFAFANHIGQSYGIEFRSFSKGLLYNDEDLKGSSTEINFNDLK